MKIKNLLAKGTQKLAEARIDTAHLDAEILLVEAIMQPRSENLDRSWLLAHDQDELDDKTSELYLDYITQRQNNKPISYITGKKGFYNLELFVNQDVLTPRPETERLVEEVIELAPKSATVIDVGTGSGAIACAIKSARDDLNVLACDISKPALKIAKKNAKKHNLDIDFIQSDLLKNIEQQFDVIVANLPYLAPTIHAINIDATHEPVDALFDGSEDGLDSYRKLISQASLHMKQNGFIVIEAEPNQHHNLLKAAHKHGYKKHSSQDFCLVMLWLDN